jgi:hypothetical protein
MKRRMLLHPCGLPVVPGGLLAVAAEGRGLHHAEAWRCSSPAKVAS